LTRCIGRVTVPVIERAVGLKSCRGANRTSKAAPVSLRIESIRIIHVTVQDRLVSALMDGGMVIRIGSVINMASLVHDRPILALYKDADSSIGSLAHIVDGGLDVFGNASSNSTSKDSLEYTDVGGCFLMTKYGSSPLVCVALDDEPPPCGENPVLDPSPAEELDGDESLSDMLLMIIGYC
jgi:hypothetical protein